MLSRTSRWTPITLLRLHLGVLLVAGGIILGVAWVGTKLVQDSSTKADRNAQAALLSADAASKIDGMKSILEASSQAFLDSPAMQTFTPAEQEALRNDLTRNDSGDPSPGLPKVVIPLSMTQATAVQSARDSLTSAFASVADLLDAPDRELAQQLTAVGTPIIEAYIAEPTATNLRLLKSHLSNVQALLNSRVPALSASAHQHQIDLRDTASTARLGIFTALLALGALVTTTAVYTTRRVRATMLQVDSERDALETTSSSLSYRNSQLNALYRVFSEITESLSMPYVVKATVTETQKLMNASGVVLRLLRGGQLVVVGAVDENGTEIEGIPPSELGAGPTGLAARRGRTQRINEGAQDQIGPAPNNPSIRLESGMIVPLIVGARIVGTLSCWSFRKSAFDDEDQRILEMMASQVATAIVAAETTDTSERRSLHDPLTGLPNRRQLDQDIGVALTDLAMQKRRAVVAMVDIDHFKHFNDEFGHRVGDVTLQQVASIMNNSVRAGDHVYRYGGEEFVIVFPDIGPGEATTLANRLRTAIESTPFSGDQLEPVGPVTVSIGLSLMPEHGTDFNVLIELADRAMYRAKDLGRNRVFVWDGEGDSAAQDVKPAA